MLKRNLCKKVLSSILAVTLVMTSALTGMMAAPMSAEAASSYANANLLVNPDFEESTAFSPAGGSHVGNWFSWQSSSKATGDAQSGNGYAKFTGSDAALEQDIDSSKMIPGMTYVYSVWAKLSGTTSAEHIIGVKNYGGAEVKQQVNSTEWKKYEIEFVYISGNPRVYGYVGTHDGVNMYIDNASVTIKSDVENVSIKNGEMTVKFVDSYVGMPTADDLVANYTIVNGNSGKVNWTNAEWDPATKTAVMTFTKIPAIAVEQVVNVNLTYAGATITLDFTVEANGEDVVTADLVSVSAENGTVTVGLDKVPTVNPTAEDFTFEYKMADGSYKTLEVKDFVYSAKDKNVVVSFTKMRGAEAKTVFVKVTYNGKSVEDTFETEVSAANTYYVDSAKGNDNNDGLSPETAFASIDKLNTINFLPGDEILFKKGETFVGCFKPLGSGTEAAPIKIASYGEGTERPVLKPGADWTVDYVMSANAMVSNVKVNYVLQFYNVEYWEVSDLEIFDPNSEAYLTPGSGKYIGNSANDVYRSGITIQAEDIGVLEHFYVDNVIIHGFHGPGTNIGKTSGGITMNVITNRNRNRELSVPTQINDIRITNCEIYDVGRSGINFLTPWSFRTEEKWGPFNYGTRGYDYLPYEDFYMANNYIYDVDGDGTIIDNCSNAVCEYNLVTRCCLRPATEGGGAAVGLFNWNSDDTYFQFNEVYDVRLGSGTSASNDGQGIEIDALNDRTWVQYNYVHDNMGGFMMLCNVGDNYRSFDGIVRYNISQNDYAHPRQGLFDIYSANYGTEVYNNTFYLTERALSQERLFLFSAVGSYETMKFYNNIFYYDGEAPVAANQFGDNAIDWQSNIFYGFTNLPQNDNPGAPNLSVDPMLVNPGKGGTGTYTNGVISKVDLSCYKLLEGSPAINAGVPLANNGGRDYFGNEVAGIPDIGAYESGSVALKLMSNNANVVVDQNAKTMTVTGKVSAKTLLESLIYEAGVSVAAKRGAQELVGGIRLAENDVVTATYNGQTITYTVKVAESTADSNVIPPERTNATAGSQEVSQSNDAATNVLDGNTGTIWHTSWGGAAAADRYLTLEVKDGYEYEISGYVYTPRTGSADGATNGIITSYEIYVSNDNATWTKVASGNWALDSEVKTVTFAPVKAKYVKLLAVASKNNFASAAEARLIGTLSDTEAPTAPVLKAETVKANSAVLQWTASTDNIAVTDYVLVMNGTEYASFDPDTTSYEVKGLTAGKSYVFEVYAVDALGNTSAKGSVTVKTSGGNQEVCKVFTDVPHDEWYEAAVQYVYDNGIMSGNEGLFKPTGNITRAQVVQTLYNLEGKPEVTDYSAVGTLVDVEGGQWYTDAVCWAYNTGVTTGNSDTKMFNMNTNVTRQQLATFIYRYAELKDYDVSATTDISAMVGAGDVADYAAKQVKWAVATGLIKGSESVGADGSVVYDLKPTGTATRAQVATILQRFCEANN